MTDTHLRWGSVRLSVTESLWTWGSSDRLRVRPHTSAEPMASRAGTRVSWASTTAALIRSTRYWVQSGSNPGLLDANVL